MEDQSAPAAYSRPTLTPYGRVTQFTHGSGGTGPDLNGAKTKAK